VLMLMLYSFSRVPQVSTLVCGVAVIVMLLRAASCTCAALRRAAARASFARPRWPPHHLTPPSSGLAVGESRLPRRRPRPCTGPSSPGTGLTGCNSRSDR